jgi:hypothetical protein
VPAQGLGIGEKPLAEVEKDHRSLGVQATAAGRRDRGQGRGR